MIDEKNRDNKEIVSEAVKKSGYNLEYASDRLRDNKEVVLKAVKKGDSDLYYASPRLCDDKEIVLEAVKQDVYDLGYASDRLRDDKEIVFSAMNENLEAVKFASPRLKKIIKDILQEINSNPLLLKNMPYWARNNKGIVYQAAKKNIFSISGASQEILEDDDFMIKCLKTSKVRDYTVFLNLKNRARLNKINTKDYYMPADKNDHYYDFSPCELQI